MDMDNKLICAQLTLLLGSARVSVLTIQSLLA